jgi:transcriptional regulator with PAS, ATPase and Fis domain
VAKYHLDRMEARYGKGITGFSPDAEALLSAHDWPGNVRELFNEVERAYLLAEPGGAIEAENLSPNVRGGRDRPHRGRTLKERLERHEREIIREVLAAHGGNRTHAAKALGISRQALILKINKLGL